MEVTDGTEVKRSRPVQPIQGASTSSGVNLEKVLNYPWPSSETLGCIVKIYTEAELMLNQVLEVVGIVSFNTPGMQDDKEDFQPPSSIIPRIHSLVVLQWDHNNPLLNQRLSPQWKEGQSTNCFAFFSLKFKEFVRKNLDASTVLTTAAQVRDELHALFTEFFKGDTLAADYLLCHLASNM